jgi:uncharacterized membrane protein
VTGLLAGLLLTAWAIRIAPRNRFLLAGLALLPPILFSRSTLDADQLTNGLAFVFAALLMREVAERGPLAWGRVAVLALVAFLFAQAKSAYLLLPLLALFIPAERFRSGGQRWAVVALLLLPGLAGSLWWMLALRTGYFAGISYETWSGLVVPDRQVAAVLAAPLGYAGVLLRTVFTTPIVPRTLVEFVGAFGPPVYLPLWFDAAAAGLLVILLLAERRADGGPLDRAPLRLAAAALALVSVTIILTLLYVQWTRLGGPVIDGWNGRYLYPLAPLAALLARGRGEVLLRLQPAHWLMMLGTLSAGATIWKCVQIY